MEDQKVGGFSTELERTPVITAAAYSSGNQVGGIQTLADFNGPTIVKAACRENGTISMLASLVVLDKAKQKAPLTIFFFNQLPVLTSSDHAALALSAAEASKCVGFVKVLASDYVDLGANMSVASVLAPAAALAMMSAAAEGALYAVVQTTGTPTYASTSDLKFKYLFSQDL